MTTIAYDGKFIAVDSRVTYRNSIQDDDFNKSFYDAETERTFFLAGDSTELKRFSEIFEHKKKIDFDINTTGIMVDRDRKVFIAAYEVKGEGWQFYEMDITGKKYVDGSGGDYALVAMDLGKTAKQAVQIAMTRDPFTGGTIRVYDVSKRKFL
jgi:hypothetical protein